MKDLTGMTLASRYRVEAFVGRGGMAEVFKVWDDKRAVHLAMKLLRDDLAEDKVFLRRFKREGQTLAKLQHPNIVRFYGLEQDGELAFILMDFVEGDSLRKEIFRALEPFSMERILDIMRAVCSALHYAHEMGMVHCDMKPGNVMLHRDGMALVSDFGIARMADASTATMVGMGTPAYMAPELVRGENPTPQTDVYSLGVIMYEMVTGGERPFTGDEAETTGSTADRVRWEQEHREAPSPCQWNPELAPSVESVILKCLEKEQQARYNSVLELLNALETALGMGQTVPAMRAAVGVSAPEGGKEMEAEIEEVRSGTGPSGEPYVGGPAGEGPQAPEQPPEKPRKLWPWLLGGSALFIFCAAVVVGSYFLVRNFWPDLFSGLAARPTAEETFMPQETQPPAPTPIPLETAPPVIPPTPREGEPPAGDSDFEGPVPMGALARIGKGSAMAIAFSPGGDTFAVGGALGVYLHDMSTRDLLIRLDADSSVVCLGYSADGSLLAAGTYDGSISIWAVDTGQRVQTLLGHLDWVRGVAFSPDGDRLVSGSDDQTVVIWDVASGSSVHTLEGHQDWVRSVDFSPGGMLVASGSDDNLVMIWNAQTGQQVHNLVLHEDWVRSVAFSPDGEWLASASDDGSIAIWDVDGGNLLRQMEGNAGYVMTMDYAPTGDYVVGGYRTGSVITWDPATGEQLTSINAHRDAVTAVASSSDDLVIGSVSRIQGEVFLWQAGTGSLEAPMRGYTSPFLAVAYSPDGGLLASANASGAATLWDTWGWQYRDDLAGHTDWVRSVAFSPDGSMLASASDDMRVILWDVPGARNLFTLERHEDWVRSVAFAHEGDLLASGADDAKVMIWDVATGQWVRTLEGHTDYVKSVACSPVGRLVASGSDDTTVILWDIDSGQLLHTLEGHDDWVRSVAFSPDGSQLASGSDDRRVIIWDVDTGQQVQTLDGHSDWVYTIAYSPDGQMIAAGTTDGMITLWNLTTMQRLRVLEGHDTGVTGLAFSPDGRILASSSFDGSIVLWEIEP